MAPRSAPAPRRPRHSMAALGVDEATEQLYRTLLRHPGSTAQALAELLTRPPAALDTALAQLRQRGLARSEGEPPAPHWHATAPDVAVELLLMARQTELNQARLILPELQEDLMQGTQQQHTDGLQLVPADPQSQLQAYLQIHQRARQDVALVLCPPFGVSAPDEIETARQQARERGVRYRVLLDPALLQWPGWSEAVRQASASGDEIRLLAQPPFKMVLADRRAGLIPLHLGSAPGPALLLGPGAALEAVCLVFDTLWRDAAPAASLSDAATPQHDPADKDLPLLLTLLASGSNDKSIADALGISDRTLQRRIQALHARLGARSRFHCGWLAARQPLASD